MLEWYLNRAHAMFFCFQLLTENDGFSFFLGKISGLLWVPRSFFALANSKSRTSSNTEEAFHLKKFMLHCSAIFSLHVLPYPQNHRFERDRKFMWPCSGVSNYQSPVFFGRLSTRHSLPHHLWMFFGVGWADFLTETMAFQGQGEQLPSAERIFKKKVTHLSALFDLQFQNMCFFKCLKMTLKNKSLSIYIYIL